MFITHEYCHWSERAASTVSVGPTDAARSDRSCKLHYCADLILKIQCFPGSTITQRLEYLFNNYALYKRNLRENRDGLKRETLTQETLVENFKQTVAKEAREGIERAIVLGWKETRRFLRV